MIRSATASKLVLWLGFFICCALTLQNLNDNPLTSPFTQIDEQGHLSYALHLITYRRWWPDFMHFNMFDVATQTEQPILNYINHPPTFYWFMKVAHALFPWWEPIHFRATALFIYLTGVYIYTRQGMSLAMPVPSSMLYALMPLMLYLHLQIGFYNNDAMSFLGGVVACISSLHWFRGQRPKRAFCWMVVGVMLASVKLTSFLLVGAYVFICILLRFSHLRLLPKCLLVFAFFAAVITILPYAMMTLSLGSPAPNTPGQLAKLIECGECATRGLAPHSDFIPWLWFFLSQLANQLSVKETTIIPIAVYFCALLFIAWSNRHAMRDGCSKPLVAMAIASAAATLITLGIHITFAWQRYVDYGWIFDSLLRYYLPLLGAYAAVSGYALASIASPSKGHHDQTHR